QHDQRSGHARRYIRRSGPWIPGSRRAPLAGPVAALATDASVPACAEARRCHMSRIPAVFDRLRRERRTGLIAYLTTGFPDLAATPELARALVEGGADIVELGIPFSDPLADGATVQRATQVAVDHGVTTADVLDVCRTLRDSGFDAPLVGMGYYN